jgi:hypothetical protein
VKESWVWEENMVEAQPRIWMRLTPMVMMLNQLKYLALSHRESFSQDMMCSLFFSSLGAGVSFFLSGVSSQETSLTFWR